MWLLAAPAVQQVLVRLSSQLHQLLVLWMCPQGIRASA
jgi:hypothetical protein